MTKNQKKLKIKYYKNILLAHSLLRESATYLYMLSTNEQIKLTKNYNRIFKKLHTYADSIRPILGFSIKEPRTRLKRRKISG